MLRLSGQLILRKIIKTVTTRCQILRFSKMHQNPKFGWGSVLGELRALSQTP